MTSTGTWRWTRGEPNNLEREKCIEMLQYGKYNRIKCQRGQYYEDQGYIYVKSKSVSS